MSPTQAMARCQNSVLRGRSVLQEEAAQKALLQCASSFSPFLESTGPGICTITLRGLSEFNLELLGLAERARNWGGRVIDRVGALQMQAQVGVAEDPDVALLAARQAPGMDACRTVRLRSLDQLHDPPILDLHPRVPAVRLGVVRTLHSLRAVVLRRERSRRKHGDLRTRRKCLAEGFLALEIGADVHGAPLPV